MRRTLDAVVVGLCAVGASCLPELVRDKCVVVAFLRADHAGLPLNGRVELFVDQFSAHVAVHLDLVSCAIVGRSGDYEVGPREGEPDEVAGLKSS